eukprot:Sspe_Gene.101319::Locus_75909_Transcript_1_1_Confidence_1.000_Length_1653::g.101319::m.101319
MTAVTTIAPDLRGSKKDPDKRKYFPPSAESPFGDFQPEFKPKKTAKPAAPPMPMEVRQSYRSKGTGNGGSCSSLNKGKQPEKPKPPVAGAFKRRPIPPTEFRRFYE